MGMEFTRTSLPQPRSCVQDPVYDQICLAPFNYGMLNHQCATFILEATSNSDQPCETVWPLHLEAKVIEYSCSRDLTFSLIVHEAGSFGFGCPDISVLKSFNFLSLIHRSKFWSESFKIKIPTSLMI
jgi:hypothetical protein